MLPASLKGTLQIVDWVYSKKAGNRGEGRLLSLTETDRLNFAARASGGTMKAAAARRRKELDRNPSGRRPAVAYSRAFVLRNP